MTRHAKPTRADLLAVATKTIPDVIASNLSVLFCGINPGLYSAFTGYHFARPGNRFWPALHAAGFTAKQLHPSDQRQLLELGYGITNLVDRASAAADELSDAEFVAGGKKLRAKVKRYRPRFVAFVGVGAYRTAFDQPNAKLGLQVETIGESKLWLLPSTSGLNAHYPSAELATLFRQLREAVERAE
jgi:double-stranded uracil-DNA glycosylase